MERQTLSTKLYIFGLIYWAFQEFLLPDILIYGLPALGVRADIATVNFLYMAINFTVTTCLFSSILTQEFKQLRPGPLFKYFGIGFAKNAGASTMINIAVMVLFPEFSNLNDANIDLMLQSRPLMIAVAVVILAPISEELLYRGIIYGFIRKKSKVAAYIVSTVLFSLIHIVGYIPEANLPTLIISFLQYLPAGLALAYSYEKSGTLLCPMLIHITVNLLAVL